MKQNSKIKSPTGQAIVEYILILTVVVLVGGGVIYQFSKGARAWGDVLFGEGGMIACLLQKGLLPAYAHIENCKNPQAAGDAFKEAFEKAERDNSNTPSSSPNSSSSTKDSNSPDENTTDNQTNSSGNSQGSHAQPKNSSSSNKSSLRPPNPAGHLTPFNSSDNASTSRLRKKRRRLKRNLSSGGSFKKNKGGHTGYNTKDGTLMEFSAHHSMGFFTEDIEEKRNRKIPISSSQIKKPNSFHTEKKPMLIQKKLKEKKQKDLNVGGWSFGNVLRFVIILSIILIIAFLIFNQAQAVKKSLK